MSSINISDLHPAGSELFSDSESYMNEISEGQLANVIGGSGFLCGVGVGVAGALAYDGLKWGAKKYIQQVKKPTTGYFDWSIATA